MSNQQSDTPSTGGEKPSLSQRFADAVTSGMGSWKFVIGQAVVLATWMTLNTTNILPIPHWDPNLILLNLTLSTEAAFAGAFILMSQNRRAEKDRETVENDYKVDLASDLTVKDINRKLDIIMAALPPDQVKALAAALPAAKDTSNDNGIAATPVKAAKIAAPGPK
ncbi:MAG TPA: DUF1003 domain-containing protein [Patescibacteria group bacterium]|nr:DUF1003 domain-containing protein [Patescibacteria group bacterium]